MTAFAVGLALELNPTIARALRTAGHEVSGHGYRWLDYREIPEDQERDHIRRTIETIEGLCGKRDDFFNLLKDAFDILWQEGKRCPKMMRDGFNSKF